MLKILKNPDPILRQKTQEIEDVLDPKIQKLIDNMIRSMSKNKGIGLAAPQVGKSLKLFVVEMMDGPLILINPKITWFSNKQEEDEEGCLSIPGKFGKVERSYKIKVKGMDRENNKISLKAEGLLARVIQHETDHLNGILFIDRLNKK
jgi:peptide deformylase